MIYLIVLNIVFNLVALAWFFTRLTHTMVMVEKVEDNMDNYHSEFTSSHMQVMFVNEQLVKLMDLVDNLEEKLYDEERYD